MRDLLRSRNAMLFLVGAVCSSFGDFALYLAAGVWVKELTGSSAQGGLIFFFVTVGALTGPAAGLLVDRVARRPLLIGANLVAAALLTPLFLVHHSNQVWIIDVVMVFYGLTGAAINAAQGALIPELLDGGVMANFNGVRHGFAQSLRLVAPGVGVGVLALAGGGAVAILDAATFVVAAGAVALTRVAVHDPAASASATVPAQATGASAATEDGAPTASSAAGSVASAASSASAAPGTDSASSAPSAKPPARPAWHTEAAAGFRHLLDTPVLRQITLACGLSVFVLGFAQSLDLSVSTVGLHHAPSYAAVLITAQGATAILGGFCAGPMMKRGTPGLAMAAGLGLMMVGLLLYSVPETAVVLIGEALIGFGFPVLLATVMTSVQANTPRPLMGRAAAAVSLSLNSPQAVGIAVGAGLVSVLFYRTEAYIVAAVVGLAALYLATRPAQRKVAADATADSGADAAAPASADPGSASDAAAAHAATSAAADPAVAVAVDSSPLEAPAEQPR